MAEKTQPDGMTEKQRLVARCSKLEVRCAVQEARIRELETSFQMIREAARSATRMWSGDKGGHFTT